MLRIKNLNQGQKLGFGKAKVNFAGLTSTLRLDEKQSGPTPVVKKLDEDEYSKYLDGIDEKKKKFTVTKQGRRRVTPLERGWTSATMQGKRFGPPEDKSTDATYDNFDSILIETKMLSPMTSLFGRTRVLRLLMITGNGNGLLGYTLSKSRWGQGQGSYRRAINRAGNRVVFYDRYENRTVYHDFFSQFGNSRVFVQQKPYGFGVSAHRIIKAACELIGIKDLRVTVEGANNPVNILKAFLLGLLRQRTHQALANEKGLHLVEFRAEMGNFPLVVASPENGKVRTEDEIENDEILDFEMVS